ncbi:porin family protein [Methyloversatilis thermotolerans]|uniref:porin n=1 Tax=Methyloversatilis thermotolerans TaxID=1346290 RepID=UPI0003818519|nr:porin [Methyloversatilis thermotolerans]
MKNISNTRSASALPRLGALAVALAACGSAQAGVTVAGPGESYLSLSMWARSSYTSQKDAAPDGSRSSDFTLDSVRIITSGKITKNIGGMINFEKKSDDSMQVIDAVAQFELADGINLWFGRMLPPTDRANLAGPYFANVWEYPGVSQYPARNVGRDDGALLWGNVAGGKLLYAVGAYQGKNRASGLSNDGDEPLYAGRLAYSFLDPELGYYGTNSYFGQKEVFTVGAAYQFQKDGVGTALTKGDYRAWNIDALFETKLAGGGVLTAEGAYYDYDTDGITDATSAQCTAASLSNNCGGATQGDAYLATLAYLIPTQVGIGKFQPYVRYQKFDADDSANNSFKQWDFGVTYVMAGHNARVTAVYSDIENSTVADTDKFIVGVQLMY